MQKNHNSNQKKSENFKKKVVNLELVDIDNLNSTYKQGLENINFFSIKNQRISNNISGNNKLFQKVRSLTNNNHNQTKVKGHNFNSKGNILKGKIQQQHNFNFNSTQNNQKFYQFNQDRTYSVDNSNFNIKSLNQNQNPYSQQQQNKKNSINQTSINVNLNNICIDYHKTPSSNFKTTTNKQTRLNNQNNQNQNTLKIISLSPQSNQKIQKYDVQQNKFYKDSVTKINQSNSKSKKQSISLHNSISNSNNNNENEQKFQKYKNNNEQNQIQQSLSILHQKFQEVTNQIQNTNFSQQQPEYLKASTTKNMHKSKARVIGFPKYSQSTKNSQINFKKQNYEQNTSLFSNQKKSINFKNPPTLENQQINDPKIFPKSCQNSQIIETNKNFSHLNPNPNPNPKASQPQPQPQSLNNTIQHPENLNETNIFSLKINDLTSSRNLVTQNKSKRNQLHFQNQQKSANILNATNFKSNLQQQFSKQTDTSIIHDKPETVDESFQSFSIKQEQEQHLKEQQEDCIFIQNSENFTQNNSSPLQSKPQKKQLNLQDYENFIEIKQNNFQQGFKSTKNNFKTQEKTDNSQKNPQIFPKSTTNQENQQQKIQQNLAENQQKLYKTKKEKENDQKNFSLNQLNPKTTEQIPHEQSQLHKQEATQLNWKEVSVPLMPEIVLKKYGYFLTDFEKKEIIAYKDVYFIGHQCNKKPKNLLITKNNYQYDNKEGDYLVQLKDHIAYRFEIIESLGQGSFGQVLKVFDHQKKEFAALKIIRNREKIYKQSIVELKILEFIKDFDTQQTSNIIKIKEYLYFRSHVIIIQEILSINLYDFLAKNQFQGVSLDLIRRFSIQILQALVFLEKYNIIHCDLKPENILLKSKNKSGLKVIDFGSSCYESEKIYTYIQSRFYRAPEILLGVPYTKRIDMWSFGCIIAELYVGYPIFPGENEREQFEMFMELMGVPDDEYLLNCQRGRVFFNDDFTPKLTYNKIGIPVRKPGTKKVNQFLNTDDKDFIDFLKKCFTWKSEDRITPAQALVHEWILKGLPQEIKIQHLQQMSQQAPDLDLQILFKQYDIQNDSQKQQELHKQMQQEVLQSRYHQKDIEKQIKQVLQNSEKMQKMVLTIKEDKFQTNSNNSSNQNIQYQQQQNKNQVIQNTNTNSLITQKQQDKQMNNTNISFNQYLKNNNNSKKQNPNPITIPQYNNFSKKIQNQIKSLSQERQAQTGYKQQRKKENLVISTNISEQQFPSQTNQNQNQNQISFPNQNQFQNQNYNKNNLVTIYSAKNKNSFPNTKKSKFNSTFHNFPLSVKNQNQQQSLQNQNQQLQQNQNYQQQQQNPTQKQKFQNFYQINQESKSTQNSTDPNLNKEIVESNLNHSILKNNHKNNTYNNKSGIFNAHRKTKSITYQNSQYLN